MIKRPNFQHKRKAMNGVQEPEILHLGSKLEPYPDTNLKETE